MDIFMSERKIAQQSMPQWFGVLWVAAACAASRHGGKLGPGRGQWLTDTPENHGLSTRLGRHFGVPVLSPLHQVYRSHHESPPLSISSWCLSSGSLTSDVAVTDLRSHQHASLCLLLVVMVTCCFGSALEAAAKRVRENAPERFCLLVAKDGKLIHESCTSREYHTAHPRSLVVPLHHH